MQIPVSLLFLAFLLAEIAGFIVVGKAIGVLATLGLVLLAMVAGSILLRRQSFATLAKVQADLAAGKTPADPLAEGAVLTLASLLIMAPGFLSDIIGIALFIRPLRAALWRAIRRRAKLGPLQRRPAYRAQPTVVDLDRSEYGASPPRSDSPWRPREGSGA
jgi:UPF0716 protein FxsA